VQESGTYLLYKTSYSQFSVQITDYRGNKDRSGVSLNDTIRSADPENPQFGENRLHLSSMVPELQLLEVAIGRNAIFHIFECKIGKMLIFINETTYRLWMPPGRVINAINVVDRLSV